ncbi:hypothetical protein LguiB_030276 [Lonicera macranthoides]
MGKRKERRLAAMTSAGRRVKLDLFAEPSGDLGGSSGQDEVGGDDDSKNHAGLPNSPSSSGQQPENPLLLLEQYSDDELDDESSKSLNNAIVENFLADLDDQAKVAAGKECEENGVNGLAAQKAEQHSVEKVSVSLDTLQKLEGNGIRESDATEADDLQREVESSVQVSVAAISDVQVGEDVSSGWKLVLHEESNQYYYWNTTTGETSWDVPNGLVQKTDAAAGENAVELEDTTVSLPSNGSMAENPNCETEETYEQRPEMELQTGHTSDVPDIEDGELVLDEFDVKMSSGSLREPYHGSSLPGKQSDDALLGNESATGADQGEHETWSNFSSSLVKHGEYLLEKLLSLKGSKDHLQGQDQLSKHILEVELRLHDIKSLLSHGSSLLPFWLHSERQLKQLEATINAGVFQSYELEKTSNVEATQKSQENLGDDIKADTTEKKRTCSASEYSQATDYDVKVSEVQKDPHNKAYNNATAHTKHATSVEYPNPLADSGAGGKHEVGVLVELSSTDALQSEEDMDMDVEMEVEDEIPASNRITRDELGAQHYSPPELPFSPHPPPPDEGFGVPPPPDDDWIPPPPPDNELVPPPPPDEPPESTFPSQPSEPESVQPFSYANQYNLSYPGSNFEYYGQTSTVPGGGYYALSDGHQLAVPLPIYYESVPNTYPGVSTDVVNPVEPVSYYGLQDGTVPPLPMVSSAESSGLVGLGSDQIRLVEAHTEGGSTSLPHTKADISAIGGETERAYVETAFSSASFEAPATISVTQGTSLSSTPAVTSTAVGAAETVPKVQSKARSKKRTVAVVSNLRSNKKVSSLVDKWKAAKDELHEEEEDEPENAYEMLEKKRRREIEQWRAQQIASGEAKDNANFQPLGGDWRERVKRRRAQMKKEAVEDTPLEEGVEHVIYNAKPNLMILKSDDASIWQYRNNYFNFLSDQSRKAYAGKLVTSHAIGILPNF